jgi:hypothetical protein
MARHVPPQKESKRIPVTRAHLVMQGRHGFNAHMLIAAPPLISHAASVDNGRRAPPTRRFSQIGPVP